MNRAAGGYADGKDKGEREIALADDERSSAAPHHMMQTTKDIEDMKKEHRVEIAFLEKEQRPCVPRRRSCRRKGF